MGVWSDWKSLGGAKVIIDGVPSTEKQLNITCIKDNYSASSLPSDFINGISIVCNNDNKLHIMRQSYSLNNVTHNAIHYEWNGSSWSSKPVLSSMGKAVELNNEINVFCGTSPFTSGYHYKLSGSSWVQVSTMPYIFYGGQAVLYNNEAHILGTGLQTSSTLLSQAYYHYKWNGTSWTSLSNLPYGFFNGVAVVYRNEIHIIGGSYVESGSIKYHYNHYKWNGTSWSSVSTIPFAVNTGNAVVVDDEIHIMSGASHYKWDGTSWTTLPYLPYNMNSGSAEVYNNNIHILGGGSLSNLASPIPYNHYCLSPIYELN